MNKCWRQNYWVRKERHETCTDTNSNKKKNKKPKTTEKWEKKNKERIYRTHLTWKIHLLSFRIREKIMYTWTLIIDKGKEYFSKFLVSRSFLYFFFSSSLHIFLLYSSIHMASSVPSTYEKEKKSAVCTTCDGGIQRVPEPKIQTCIFRVCYVGMVAFWLPQCSHICIISMRSYSVFILFFSVFGGIIIFIALVSLLAY